MRHRVEGVALCPGGLDPDRKAHTLDRPFELKRPNIAPPFSRGPRRSLFRRREC
jgi:hypothetical protein